MIDRSRRPATTRSRGAWVAVLLAVMSAPSAAVAQGYNPVTVVKSGDPAPGTASGVTFGPAGSTTAAAFFPPPINSSGTVGFFASLTGPDVNSSNNLGIWRVSPGGTPELVARMGSPVPIGSGNSANLSQITTFPGINGDGRVIFMGTLVQGGPINNGNNSGIWVGPPGGSLQLIAREGDPVPSLTGVNYGTFDGAFPRQPLNGSTLMFQHTPSDGRATIFIGTPGDVAPLARGGTTAPGTGGATFENNGINFSTANPTGTIAFRGSLVQTGGVNATNATGVWAGTVGNVQQVWRQGEIAPTLGTVFTGSNGIAVLANGQVAVNATAAVGGSVTDSNNQGMYVGTSTANLQLVAREGQTIPNSGGATLGGIGVLLANGNTVGFKTLIAGAPATSDRGIFTWNSASGLVMVAREGNEAPGTGGALFGDIGTGVSSPLGLGALFTVGPNGEAAFYAPLTGGGVNATNDTGIWVQTPGGLMLVARKGQQIDLDPGAGVDLATIANLGLYDNSESGGAGLGNPSGFSSVGGQLQVAWIATFADGRSAMIVSAVPEPASVLALAAGALVVGMRVRRRLSAG